MAERRRSDASARPVDRLLGGYLLLSAGALLLPGRGPGWAALLLLHLVLGALLLWGAPTRLAATAANAAGARGERGLDRAIGWLLAWYPLLLVPFLYWELPQLIGGVHGEGFLDAVVMAWEERLFGHQPSAALAAAWDSRPLSEILHFFYLSYYPAIFLVPAALHLRGRQVEMLKSVFALMLGFTASYAIFILFPVQGPRYLFPAPGGEAAKAVLYGLTHTVLETGSSRGAAFPSAHAAIAVVQTVNAARYLPRLTPVLALITIGICGGAVYGGFHYAVDMAAGVILGLAVGLLAPRVREALR